VVTDPAYQASARAADRDCGDFATQRKAQIFFLRHGGPRRDPHRLDADNDGVACEANPCPCYRKKVLPCSTSSVADRRVLF
jgi:Excalibur calcium-binding domain